LFGEYLYYRNIAGLCVVNMFDNLRMGFPKGIHSGKPFNHLYSTNPFTKVNGNLYINSNFVGYLLPSAFPEGMAMPS